jgi:quinol monooxygenase YgiN
MMPGFGQAGRRMIALAGLAAAFAVAPIATQADAPGSGRMVRIAELSIDPAQIDAYRALLAEEVGASVGKEPGVLMLYAMAIKGAPAEIRLVEIYADKASYEAHLRSPQFLKYKQGTASMVRSLRLIETDPIRLCAKGGYGTGQGC